MGYFRTFSWSGCLLVAVLGLSAALHAQAGLVSDPDSSDESSLPADYSWNPIEPFTSPVWFTGISQLPPGTGPFLMTGNSANEGGGLVTIVLNPPLPDSEVLTPEPATAWLSCGALLLGFGVRRLRFGRLRFGSEKPE